MTDNDCYAALMEQLVRIEAELQLAQIVARSRLCAFCGRSVEVCDADKKKGCGTTQAGEDETQTVSATIAPAQWDMCPVCDLPKLYCRGH